MYLWSDRYFCTTERVNSPGHQISVLRRKRSRARGLWSGSRGQRGRATRRVLCHCLLPPAATDQSAILVTNGTQRVRNKLETRAVRGPRLPRSHKSNYIVATCMDRNPANLRPCCAGNAMGVM